MSLVVTPIFLLLAVQAFKPYLCTNVDGSVHLNLVRYYAFQETFNQNEICPNFAAEERQDNLFMSHISNGYVTTLHMGVAMISLLLGTDAGLVLVVVCILSLLISVLISCRMSGRFWPFNLAILVFSPSPISVILTNGWVIQNIVTMIGLGMLYVLVRFQMTTRLLMLPPFAVFVVLLTLMFHDQSIFWSPFVSSLDTYRSIFSLQFMFVPAVVFLFSRIFKDMEVFHEPNG